MIWNDLDYLDYIKNNEVRIQQDMRLAQPNPTPLERDMLVETVQHMPSVPEANYAFQSRGNLSFVNRASEWGLDDPGFSSGAAYADFDNDGAMDLVVNNVNSPAVIYKNMLYQDTTDSPNNNNFLKIKINGKRPQYVWNRNQSRAPLSG
ncbi:MAG: VCBS repeat-containing protein [FCB group bacterium]|nr:VCBS repeat-containing protein [FCB group bacterium]